MPDVSESFEYRIVHIVTAQGDERMRRSVALTNDAVRRLPRYAEQGNTAHEACDHCEAQLRVELPSFADVRRERRLHRTLWKVWAVATVLSGYGFVHVARTSRDTGYGPEIAFVVTVCGTLFFGYRTLVSGMISRSNGAPAVTRVDRRERGNVRHSWAFPPEPEAP
ncbi:hypothetical protein JK359_10330 [Streptomyces actinomycinicus]|uniref:Uncharacterized protein n=1 Tax=Streptomyces actinomycinicus TaxID=1695166 RepID=A0A937JKC7_9ACTN|nr:hypothetical protein [Streptomyces actinomycinicus]MBL1082374.1 hypothetical protein [Streptomyces actinomycinicus]